MDKIRLHYDIETGEIRGYYPLHVNYIEVPKPYIEITKNQYESILHNESKFRIQNKELTDISESVDYRLNCGKKLIAQASKLIVQKAEEATEWGVIFVDNQFYVNVHWKDYYESLQKLIEKTPQEISARIYVLNQDKYCFDFKKLNSAEAQEFLEKVLSAIESYKTQYITEKQNEFLTELKTIKSAKNYSGITNFINTIDYGYVLNESEITVPLNV